jgi:hypothetical protein
MAGVIVADTLQDGAGNSTTMDNAIYGSAKAWVNFNGNGSTTINASYNVSSVTYVNTGRYTVNFTNALTDANYAAICNSTVDTGSSSTYVFLAGIEATSGAPVNKTSSSLTVMTMTQTTSFANSQNVSVTCFR